MIPEGRSPQGIVGSGTSQPQPRYHPALAFIFHPFTHTQPHTQPHTQQKRRVPHPSRPHRDGWERTPFPRPLLQLLAIPTSPQFAILSVVEEPVLSGVEGTRAWSSS